nr:polyprotein 2 [pineapple secovirus B]WCR39277.1 polyprotein 2 [pineapple secovirus B]
MGPSIYRRYKLAAGKCDSCSFFKWFFFHFVHWCFGFSVFKPYKEVFEDYYYSALRASDARLRVNLKFKKTPAFDLLIFYVGHNYFPCRFCWFHQHYHTTFRCQLKSVVMSQTRSVQEVFTGAGRQLGTSASNIARSLSQVGDETILNTASPIVKMFDEAVRNKNFHVLPRRVQQLKDVLSRVSKKYVHFDIVDATTSAAVEDAVVETPIPLDQYVNIDKAEESLRSKEEKKLDIVNGKTCIVEAIALQSTSNTPATSGGVVLTMAVDSRANNPEDAILGGHIHVASRSDTAGSMFMPFFKLNTRDPYLSTALKIMTISSGFDMKEGSIVATIKPLVVGEIVQDPQYTTIKKGVLKEIMKAGPVTHTDHCLPIHPRLPEGPRSTEIVVPWESATQALLYSHTADGTSVWKNAKKGKQSVIFELPRHLTSTRRVNQIIAETSDPNLLGRTDVREVSDNYTEQGSGDREEHMPSEGFGGQEKSSGLPHAFMLEESVVKKDDVPLMKDRGGEYGSTYVLEDDKILFSARYVVDNTAETGASLVTVQLMDDILSRGFESAVARLALIMPIVEPIIKIRVTYTIPSLCSVPLILSWDESGDKLKKAVVLERILNQPSIIMNSHSVVTSHELVVRPAGHTGRFNLFASGAERMGAFHIVSCGHKLKGDVKVNLAVDILFCKNTIMMPLAHRPDRPIASIPNATFKMLERVSMGDVNLHHVLSLHKFTDKSPTGDIYLISVVPGICSISEKGTKSFVSTFGKMLTMWNFWRGDAIIEVSCAARKSIAGSCTFFVVPPGVETALLSPTILAGFPFFRVDFSMDKPVKFKFPVNSWLNWCVTQGIDDFDAVDTNNCESSLIMRLDQAPYDNMGDAVEVLMCTRIVAVKNLEVSERASCAKQKGANFAKTFDMGRILHDQVLTAYRAQSEVPGLQNEGFAQSLVFYPLEVAENGEGARSVMLSFPVCFNYRDDMFERRGQGKAGLVYIDHLNPYHQLFSGVSYYSCGIEVLIYVEHEDGSSGKAIAVFKNGSMENHVYGQTTATNDGNYGGGVSMDYMSASGALYLRIEPRNFNCRGRVRMKQSHRFLDTYGVCHVSVPPFDVVKCIRVFTRPFGKISIYGVRTPEMDVDANSGKRRCSCVYLTNSGASVGGY